MQNKLNFEIAPYDDFLEARVPEGFYTIDLCGPRHGE